MNTDLETLNEPIEVVTVFKRGHHPCLPVKFKRVGGREVNVTELGLSYPLPHGLKTVHIFDVTDGSTDYRLEFDSQSLTWRLTMEASHYE